MSAALIARLVAEGVSPELIGDIAEALADARAAERILEKRRAADRERKAVSNPRIPRNSTEAEESAEIQGSGFLDKKTQTQKINPSREVDSLPAREALDLPEGVTGELWDGYRAMRRKIRKPLTPYAEQLALKRLRKFAEDGYPPGEIVEAAIAGSYQGLFAPKDKANGRTNGMGRHQPGDGLSATTRAAAAVFGSAPAREPGAVPQ